MRPEMKPLRTSALLLAVLALCPATGLAQSGPDLMQAALDAQADRLSGIENVTIVQEVMGLETSVRMEKTELDGTPVLMPVSVSVGGMTNPIPQDMAQADWASPFQAAWVDRAKAEGQETLDGHRTHILVIDDFSGLEMPGMPGGGTGAGEMTPQSVRVWLDADDLVTRKVVMDMKATKDDGSTHDVHMELFMDDYREVDGYLHPFMTRMVTEGLMDSLDVDQAELKAQVEQVKAQLEGMPEAQRKMLEGVLGAQIEQMESMLGGGEGMEITITVKQIKVNSGQ